MDGFIIPKMSPHKVIEFHTLPESKSSVGAKFRIRTPLGFPSISMSLYFFSERKLVTQRPIQIYH